MKQVRVAMVFAAIITTAHAATVTLRSGNGAVGGTDSLITFELGPGSSDFAALTAADFTAARTGPAASIITPNPAWIATLPADPTALWIATNPGGATGLYAISFNLPLAVSSGSINLNYAVDNQLGSATNQGVFINGTALPGSTGGTFTSQFNFSSSSIGPLLHAGTNTLYIDAVNTGGPAGLIFSATISTQDVTGGGGGVPEPASIGVTLLGVAALVFRSVRNETTVS